MALPPQRTTGSIPVPTSRGSTGGTLEIVRQRVLAKLPEKLDAVRLRRMPASFMQQEVRRTVEQIVETEGARLGRLERELLVEDLMRDAAGYGPLEELFNDLSVKEILVLNPQMVLSRREGADEQSWMPTNVKFRDADHLGQVVAKAASLAEPQSGDKQPSSVVEGRLSNGFRVFGVVPPAILSMSPYVLFVRGEPAAATVTASNTISMAAATRSTSTTPPPATQPFSAPTPATTRPASLDPAVEMLARLRTRITEHISSKLATLGVANTSRLDVRELQKAITAYVHEFCRAERVTLSEVNEAKMIQDILMSLRSPV